MKWSISFIYLILYHIQGRFIIFGIEAEYTRSMSVAADAMALAETKAQSAFVLRTQDIRVIVALQPLSKMESL